MKSARQSSRTKERTSRLSVEPEHLLSFCNRKSLNLRQREALLHWVMDYLMSISGNPFSVQADLAALHDAVEQQMNILHPPAAAFLAGSDPGDADGVSRARHTDDKLAGLFGDFEDEEDDDDEFDEFAES